MKTNLTPAVPYSPQPLCWPAPPPRRAGASELPDTAGAHHCRLPAGTGPDIVARLLAQKLSEGWGNLGVIVDNKPGAGGLIAASEAARATPTATP